MREIIHYERCKKEFLKKVEPDKDKIISILKVSKARVKSIQQIKKDRETSSIIAVMYYETIRELLTALLLKNGLKSGNHECLISFFKETYPEYEYESFTVHQLKNIRNRINYDGIFVEPSYLEQNEPEFRHSIDVLEGLIRR
ncbi:hypothetical protein QT06_C0001G0560 [archaeon GW2011_AR15]|nr:hypothetical protein QT06_C0001G0560 [archaeon GW2011_AR15]MBS3103871.1 hypothetical protein [Candidatus Woesearchaeota archaeon]